MNRRMVDRRSSVALAACAFALCACSSDAPTEPEPTLDTVGAFVALEQGTDALMLFRNLSPWTTEAGVFLFVTIYDVEPTTWDEAREISKSHEIPIRTEVGLLGRDDTAALPHRVVWYRSLTREEEDRIP
jgi:hypothetical protein